jgi:3-hydroxyacyl-CoA dehydrogenase
MTTDNHVAVIGTGVIGRSWLRVFAAAGWVAHAYDENAMQLERALAWLTDQLARDCEQRFLTPADAQAIRERIRPCTNVAAAVATASYVQENGPELLDVKRAIFADLECIAPAGAILASSTSALDMTEIAQGLRSPSRCIVAHPVNPPHVIPVVEIVPGRETAADTVQRTIAILTAAGQKPVLLRSFVPGFLLNRMQAALLREAIALLKRGVADASAIDAVVRDGLGLRWALLGPFGVASTNADQGIREYLHRFGQSYTQLMNDLSPTPDLDESTIDEITAQTAEMFGNVSLEELRAWRDAMVRRIRRLKEEFPGRLPAAPDSRSTATSAEHS